MLRSDSNLDFSIIKELHQPTRRGRKVANLIGRKFERLTPLGFLGLHKGARWLCQCACGNLGIFLAAKLLQDRTKSCGCWNNDRIGSLNRSHGMTKTVVYRRWADMMTRCYNPKFKQYADYGGRGIVVVGRWHVFENFFVDIGHPPSREYQIDRLDNDGNYGPGNCAWRTKKNQARNTRTNRYLTIDGETYCVAEWAERRGIRKSIVYERLRDGWTPEEALELIQRTT